LASRGYTLGANLVVESRSTQGDPKRFPGLIEELTKIPVNLLVTLSYPAARAAKDRAPTLPIVVVGTGDPVESGLVVSLARPGGNMTGISDVAAELAPKRLELLKAAATGLKKVAMLWNADDLGMTLRYRATAAAAAALGVTVQSLGVREPDDFNEAFAAMDRDRPDGILMVSDALTFLNRKKVFEFAAPRHLPAIYELESWVRAGGLMSYGPDFHEVADRAAAQVDRILKGAKPADLPFEQPTRFRLVVNRKIADALD
jgi:putative ABC transport system substrate-binding protein